jgi:hypothetical protein
MHPHSHHQCTPTPPPSTLYTDRGGEPELEALLAEGGVGLSVARLERIFPFPLDSFQRKAVEQFLDGNSVVVCAPTGRGCRLRLGLLPVEARAWRAAVLAGAAGTRLRCCQGGGGRQSRPAACLL